MVRFHALHDSRRCMHMHMCMCMCLHMYTINSFRSAGPLTDPETNARCTAIMSDDCDETPCSKTSTRLQYVTSYPTKLFTCSLFTSSFLRVAVRFHALHDSRRYMHMHILDIYPLETWQFASREIFCPISPPKSSFGSVVVESRARRRGLIARGVRTYQRWVYQGARTAALTSHSAALLTFCCGAPQATTEPVVSHAGGAARAPPHSEEAGAAPAAGRAE
jgi:hypothetical protein